MLPEINSVIVVTDEITGETENSTVIYIEPDVEFPKLFYIYLKAEEPTLNNKFDSKFSEPYWKIITLEG